MKSGSHRSTVLVLFCLAHSVIALGQSTPAVEVFGGYSLLHSGSFDVSGWNGAATGNVNRWLGVSADFAGHYSRQSSSGGQVRLDSDVYSFMFGPQVAYRASRYTLFSHALFGLAHQRDTDTFSTQGPSTSISSSANHFQLALGGGLDITVKRAIALRPIQADYVLTDYASRNVNQFRYSAGVVLRLGTRNP